jgi:uncharacterized protein (DUF1501 family)
MKMDRRDFLKWTSTAGLVLGGSGLWTAAGAESATHDGPYWLTINAAGGWDPTLLCDPKGRTSASQTDPVNNYYRDDIVEVGPFKVPPVEGHQAFFERFKNQLLVINGVDSQTNSHETGNRYTWSGSMDPGFPAFSALVAAAQDPRPSLSFLTNGGYSETAGSVAPTRIPDTKAIAEIAFPDQLVIDDEASFLHHPSTMARIQAAREARHERQLGDSTLPREQRALSILHEARTGKNELAQLAETLPATIDNSNNRLIRQAQVAMACFKAGVTISANLSIGGFDTHGNHDNSHTPNMQRIVEAITYAMDEAERLGIADKLNILVGSDFGRTPWYNENNGKDHWSITSVLAMGPGIEGGRVVGATTDYQSPMTVDPTTLALSESGTRIHPAHIHAALRELAGMDKNPVISTWKLDHDPLPLWGTP